MATDIEPPEDAVEGDSENTSASWVEALQADTPKEEIRHRVMPGGRTNPDGTPATLAYVTARYVQDRLDAAVTPACWQSMFTDVPGGVRCGIGILIGPNGVLGGEGAQWVWKWDVGIASSIEPTKGAHSDAFKRAGVQWGIARDLYDERDEDQPAPQVAQGNVRARVTGQDQSQAASAQYSEDGAVGPDEPEWVCPVHDDSKVVPAGISKRTGRKYNAFYACPVAGCDNKGPSVK